MLFTYILMLKITPQEQPFTHDVIKKRHPMCWPEAGARPQAYSRESIRIARTTRELLKRFVAAYHAFVDMEALEENNKTPGDSNKVPFSKIPDHYGWWLKSCTTWDVWNPINNGKNYLSTGAGFQPSTVSSRSLMVTFWRGNEFIIPKKGTNSQNCQVHCWVFVVWGTFGNGLGSCWRGLICSIFLLISFWIYIYIYIIV